MFPTKDFKNYMIEMLGVENETLDVWEKHICSNSQQWFGSLINVQIFGQPKVEVQRGGSGGFFLGCYSSPQSFNAGNNIKYLNIREPLSMALVAGSNGGGGDLIKSFLEIKNASEYNLMFSGNDSSK